METKGKGTPAGGGRTTVVSFSSIKGGVGKTHAAILLANALASAGKRVLLIDSDLNNSLSFHYLDAEAMRESDRRNLYYALSDEKQDLSDFAVRTRTEGVSLIASSPHLADIRAVNEWRLSRMLPSLYGKYDTLIIDCHPTYDNIVLNALHAADYVITPVLKDTFSYNAAKYLAETLPRDAPDVKNWFVLLNGYNSRFEESKSGLQKDFLDLYRDSGWPLTPPETWLPWTAQIHQVVDYHRRLTSVKGTAGAEWCPALYHAVRELAGCFYPDARLEIQEAF